MGFDSRPDYSLAAAATFLALCSVVVPLRFYARHRRNSGYGWDDWLAVAALLMVIGCAVTFITGIERQVLGYPMPAPSGSQDPKTTPNANFTLAEKLEWAFFLMQILSMGLVKLSFLFFFRRIFVQGKSRSRFNIISTIAVVIIILWTAAFFFWFLFSCRIDFAARWTTISTLHSGCSTDVSSDFSLAITDMLTDLMVLAMPVPMVLRLQMKLKRKLAVLAIFGMGTLTLIASIVRFALFTWVLRLAVGVVKDNGADEVLLITRAMYWSMIESGLALIACCLPIMSSLARRDPNALTIPRPTWTRFRRNRQEKPPTVGFTDSMLQVSKIELPRGTQQTTTTTSTISRDHDPSISASQWSSSQQAFAERGSKNPLVEDGFESLSDRRTTQSMSRDHIPPSTKSLV